MLNNIKAVIFDMDGVIIDSEPLWRKIMISSFTEIGIPFTEDDCRVTTGLRFEEVADFWFKKHGIIDVSTKDFNNLVINRLCDLISEEGKLMPGVKDVLSYLKHNGYLIGLATSSNHQLMNHVLNSLAIGEYFTQVCSAEFLQYGKPHPEVFLVCAQKLAVEPQHCLVIEDSLNGLIAAKAARMTVLVVPENESADKPAFCLADYRLSSLKNAPFLAK